MYISDLASLGTTQRTEFRPNLPQVLPMTFPFPPQVGEFLDCPHVLPMSNSGTFREIDGEC